MALWFDVAACDGPIEPHAETATEGRDRGRKKEWGKSKRYNLPWEGEKGSHGKGSLMLIKWSSICQISSQWMDRYTLGSP